MSAAADIHHAVRHRVTLFPARRYGVAPAKNPVLFDDPNRAHHPGRLALEDVALEYRGARITGDEGALDALARHRAGMSRGQRLRPAGRLATKPISDTREEWYPFFMNHIRTMAALLTGIALATGAAPLAARADVIVITDHGQFVAEGPRFNSGGARLLVAGIPTHRRLAVAHPIVVEPFVIAAAPDRGSVLRARALLHARLLARRG